MEAETEYRKENRLKAEKVHATGPLYAAEFSRLSGRTWFYVDTRPEDAESSVYSRGYHLTERETGIIIALHVEEYHKKGTASVCLPNMPNGGEHGTRTAWREWGFMGSTGHRVAEAPTASVSADRFLSEVPACAKRFYNLVYVPYAAVYPQVANKIAETAAGYREMDRVAGILVSEFNGKLSTNNRQDSTRTVYFPASLPSVTVQYGGHLRVEHPSFTLRTFKAYARAVLAQKES